jgi:hypothetical protein
VQHARELENAARGARADSKTQLTPRRAEPGAAPHPWLVYTKPLASIKREVRRCKPRKGGERPL